MWVGGLERRLGNLQHTNSLKLAPGMNGNLGSLPQGCFLSKTKCSSRATYRVTALFPCGVHSNNSRVPSRWGSQRRSVAPFHPGTTVDTGSYYFCRCASAVIIQHERQRKGHKREFIFSSLRPMAPSSFMLFLCVIRCVAGVS